MRRLLTLLLLMLFLPGIALGSGGFALFLGTQTTGSAALTLGEDVRLTSSLQPAIYLEGRIESGTECFCVFLQTVESERYQLVGDLGGFTCGDRVGVWGTECLDCVSDCMEGRIFVVEDIVGLADPVGGIAELPDVSDSSAPNYLAPAGLAAAALAALAAGTWYARRQWLR
jgi:hypothetical protein